MKKALPYIIGGVLVLLLLVLVMAERKKNFDPRITLNKKDKIPYGSYVAYHHLNYIFPDADITINKKQPGYWEDSVLQYDTGHQAIIILTKEFNATDDELRELFHFVSKGNDVLISSYDLSRDAQDFFHLNLSYGDAGFAAYEDLTDMDTL